MGREDNLIPGQHKLTNEERVKGALASAQVKRDKKNLRKALEALLEKDYPQKDKQGNVIRVLSGTEALTTKLFEQAMKGNVKAFETIRSTIGQDPVQKIAVQDIDQSVIEEVENIVLQQS